MSLREGHQKGRAQKGWAKKFDCTGAGNGHGGCGAKPLVEQADLFRTQSHHYDGSSESYVTFKCTECSVLTDIKDYISFSIPSQSQWLSQNE